MKTINTSNQLNFIDPLFSEGTPRGQERNSLSSEQYQQALEALDLDEREKALYMDRTQLDRFRSQLEQRLSRTKLWNYAPDQRDAVKEARARLQEMLGLEISFR